MTENPTDYDLIQDSRILGVETILSNAAEPPSGGEFSYPVVGQAVSSSMWQWITRGQGDGIIEVGGWPYRLTDLDNASNTGTLTVSTVTGTANAVVAGFFHQLSESMTLSFPMPSSGTVTYYVCLTHDPREENTTAGPVSVQVYSSTPPTTFSRTHVVLYTVRRAANQLLTDAVVEGFRPRVAPTMLVARESQLGDPRQRLWGTLAVAHESSEWFMAMGSSSDSGGPTQWKNLSAPEWHTYGDTATYRYPGHGARMSYTRHNGFVHIEGRMERTTGAAFQAGNTDGYQVLILPPGFRPPSERRFVTSGAGLASSTYVTVHVRSDGIVRVFPSQSTSWVGLDGISFRAGG